MWVYIWTNTYEYSYDFRNKSTSQITADGWTTWSGTPSISSIGYTSANSSTARSSKTLPSLANAKKITLISTIVTSGDPASWLRLFWDGRTYATWPLLWSSSWQLQYAWDITNISWLSAWTYGTKTVVDLENSTITFSITWKSDTLVNLTSTQVNNIKNQITNLEVFAWASWTGVTSMSILIE